MTKLKSIVVRLNLCGYLLGAAAFVQFGCNATRPPLTLRAIPGLKVQEFQRDNQLHLKISGAYFNGARALGVPDTFMQDDCLVVRVYSELATRKSSGLLDVTLPVDARVNTVAFGTPEDVIWRRKN